ncbi:MAG TPA: MBL fold metallo-hydrolase [Acetobacteraceae bacterium]|nr:MBL fold metallo-hydrolase [Acetobacteraceae bacterium]
MIRFFQRPYPSANSVLLLGHRPVLVDTGFGADVPQLRQWLTEQGTPAQALSLLINTHSHCDHAGGNHALQSRFGITVAASASEAAPVNARDPDACQARWLHQPIEAYQVGRMLEDGDQVATGNTVWDVLATPGHTAGHLSLHCKEHGNLILGDALHDADLGWLNPYREGADSLDRAEETVALLETLQARVAYSGHGPAITDLPAAFARARRRLQSWREDPHRIAWHACKRIFAHALMLEDGLGEAALEPHLLACPWFHDHATLAFQVTPHAFVPMLVREMLRADAAYWSDGKLLARAPYAPVRPGWPASPASPALWPPPQPIQRQPRIA